MKEKIFKKDGVSPFGGRFTLPKVNLRKVQKSKEDKDVETESESDTSDDDDDEDEETSSSSEENSSDEEPQTKQNAEQVRNYAATDSLSASKRGQNRQDSRQQQQQTRKKAVEISRPQGVQSRPTQREPSIITERLSKLKMDGLQEAIKRSSINPNNPQELMSQKRHSVNVPSVSHKHAENHRRPSSRDPSRQRTQQPHHSSHRHVKRSTSHSPRR